MIKQDAEDIYGWIITRDFLFEENEKHPIEGIPNKSEVGIIGGHDTKFTKEELLSKGVSFRMKDDDGELYYEGKLLGGSGFEPLDDFGLPNAGCTSIWIKENRKWVEL